MKNITKKSDQLLFYLFCWFLIIVLRMEMSVDVSLHEGTKFDGVLT